MSNVLDIQNLEITFATDRGPVKAVDRVSLEVAPRSVLAVVGESGSGKTVTAKTVLGLLPETAASRGVVLLANTSGGEPSSVLTLSPEQLRAVRGRDVAMVFQEASTALNPVYTVGWQIAEGLRAHGKVSKKAARAQAIDMLRKVGIPEPERRVDSYPHQLSGGQKQRVVIAMALALNPGLIVADEPTTALDVTVQAEILDLLRECRDSFGASILLITHNMGVVADLAPFFPDIAGRLGTAHLVVARAGASTVSELECAGRPSVLVPLPSAIDDHQNANARALAEADAAWVYPQPAFTPAALTERLTALFSVPVISKLPAPSVRASVSTGKFCRLLTPVSPSPVSLAVTPSSFRSMPRPPLP